MQLPISPFYTPFGTYGTNRILPSFNGTTTYLATESSGGNGMTSGIFVTPCGPCSLNSGPLSSLEQSGTNGYNSANTSSNSALLLNNGQTLVPFNTGGTFFTLSQQRQQFPHSSTSSTSHSSSTPMLSTASSTNSSDHTSIHSKRTNNSTDSPSSVHNRSAIRSDTSHRATNSRTSKIMKNKVENFSPSITVNDNKTMRVSSSGEESKDGNSDLVENEPQSDKLQVEHHDVLSMNGEETLSTAGTDSGMSLHADPTSTTDEEVLNPTQSNKEEEGEEEDDAASIGIENRTNLIVNYLPQHMSQEEIRALFSSIGQLVSCKLIRDKSTGQSLGYGFVNYSRTEDAEKAVSMLNGLRLQNKIIKVSVARPSSETIKGANLYICGLSKSMSQAEMEKLFTPHGKIITSRILYDINTGLSKGVGFIRFDQRHEADLAIKRLHGYIIPGTNESLTVKFANSPTNTSKNNHQYASTSYGLGTDAVRAGLQSTGNKQRPKNSGTSIANGQLDYMTAHHSISAIPSHPCGPVNMTSHNGVHLFTASPLSQPTFFPMASHLEITASGCPLPLSTTHPCHMSINPQQGIPNLPTQLLLPPPSQPSPNLSALPLANHKCSAALLTHLPNSYQSVTLFVSNLPPEADDTLLWHLFGQFGTPCSVKAVKDSATLGNGSRRCKGFGFVTMPTYEEALVAMHYMNGFNLGNRVLHVNFKASNRGSQSQPNGKVNTYNSITPVILQPIG